MHNPGRFPEFFIFNFTYNIASGAKSTATVVYCASPIISADQAEAVLTEYFDGVNEPEQVWLLASRDSKQSLVQAATDPSLLDRMPAITRYVGTPTVCAFVFDGAGDLYRVAEDGQIQELRLESSLALWDRGVRTIFDRHQGILDARGGFHYVHPNNRHSDHFIRTGNVLRYGAEISFVAAAMLRYLRPDQSLTTIYTDTSSVLSVAYALLDHCRRLEKDIGSPVIDSFGSYDGLHAGYQLDNGRESLCIISASSGGGLARKIINTGRIPHDRIVILFHVGDSCDDLQILCDLTIREGNPDGTVERFKTWEASDCQLCSQNQTTVRLTGDQFLPANPTVEPLMIKATHAPRWLGPFSRDVYGLNAIRAHVNMGRPDSVTRTVYFDIGPILNGQDPDAPLYRSFITNVTRNISAFTSWIVHLDDPGSLLMAMKVHALLGEIGIELPLDRIVSAEELSKNPEQHGTGEGVCLVVASAVVSARSLLNISRLLRVTHIGKPITYLVFIARMSDSTRWRDAASNLQYGEARPKEHGLFVVQELELPSDRFGSGDPWMREVHFWQGQQDIASDPNVFANLEDRITALDYAESNGGLADSLFLPGFDEVSNPVALRLNPNFAFWPFKYEEHPLYIEKGIEPSQAEVFFTMLSVLHGLRQNRTDRQPILSREHNWTVLAPGNFARFNDPIIQASILRAANPFELDYSFDKQLSSEMADIIRPIVLGWNEAGGAAASEILLSIALGDLRLAPDVAADIRASLADVAEDMPGLLRALAQSVCRVDTD